MLSTNDLAAMRAILLTAMQDTCIIQTYTEAAANALSEKVISYTDGSAIDCAYSPGGGSERNRATGTIAVKSASVRMALGNTVTVKDKIKVTHLKGTALGTALTFGVSNVRRHISALVVDLEEVE